MPDAVEVIRQIRPVQVAPRTDGGQGGLGVSRGLGSGCVLIIDKVAHLVRVFLKEDTHERLMAVGCDAAFQGHSYSPILTIIPGKARVAATMDVTGFCRRRCLGGCVVRDSTPILCRFDGYAETPTETRHTL